MQIGTWTESWPSTWHRMSLDGFSANLLCHQPWSFSYNTHILYFHQNCELNASKRFLCTEHLLGRIIWRLKIQSGHICYIYKIEHNWQEKHLQRISCKKKLCFQYFTNKSSFVKSWKITRTLDYTRHISCSKFK